MNAIGRASWGTVLGTVQHSQYSLRVYDRRRSCDRRRPFHNVNPDFLALPTGSIRAARREATRHTGADVVRASISVQPASIVRPAQIVLAASTRQMRSRLARTGLPKCKARSDKTERPG